MSCADGISAITDDAKDLSELVATADLNAEREKALRNYLHDESVECGEGVQNAGDVKMERRLASADPCEHWSTCGDPSRGYVFD